MRGSIRAFVGFLIAYGAVGGIETESASLLVGTMVAVAGLAIMASGVSAMRSRQFAM